MTRQNADLQEISRVADIDSSVNPLEIAFDPQKAVAKVEAVTKAIDGCVKVSISRTNIADWVRMKKGDKESFYLQATGAQKVRAVWGIYFRDRVVTKEMNPDGSFAYHVSGICGSKLLDSLAGGEVTIEVDGGRSSSDAFFVGKDGNKFVDPMDVRKAAVSNWEARAVCNLLGLKNMTAEDLIRNGIDPAKVAGYEFKAGAEGGGNTAVISEPQAKRLFALTASAGLRHDDVKAYIKKKYGFDSSSQITRASYDEICKWIQSGGAKAPEQEIQV